MHIDLKYKILIAFLVIMFAGYMIQKYKSSEEFSDIVDNSKKDVLVQFYKMKQCGHCVSFAPIFNEFMEEIKKTNQSVGFQIVDADDVSSQTLITENKIEGFPTVIFIKDGTKHVFDKDRTVQALQTFLAQL